MLNSTRFKSSTCLICSKKAVNLFSTCSQFVLYKMASSHKGYPDSYWTSKIKELATGKLFGKGERPQSGMLYPKKLRSALSTETPATWLSQTSPPPVSTVITIHFWNIWNKKNAHACSIQNICTRLMHLNLFQILFEIVLNQAIKMHG